MDDAYRRHQAADLAALRTHELPSLLRPFLILLRIVHHIHRMTFLNINLRKGILWSVLAIPGLILPAFAQQEVDPTYYDPWAAAPKVVAHPVHTTANHKMVVRKKDPSVARAKETHPTQARANMPPAAQKVTLQLALK